MQFEQTEEMTSSQIKKLKIRERVLNLTSTGKFSEEDAIAKVKKQMEYERKKQEQSRLNKLQSEPKQDYNPYEA